jgi:hypothetical protein
LEIRKVILSAQPLTTFHLFRGIAAPFCGEPRRRFINREPLQKSDRLLFIEQLERDKTMAKISGKFSGNVNWQTVVPLPHDPGHIVSLGEVSGPQDTDDPKWQDVSIQYWGAADLVNGSGKQSGHWVNNHANGDKDFGTFEGQITTSGGQTIMEGTWKYTGGTGQFANIHGGGTYKGHLPTPDQIENTWEGEYEL